MNILHSLKTKLLSLDLAEAKFTRRGFFESTDNKRRVYESIGTSFISGFNLQIASRRHDHDAIHSQIDQCSLDQRGFLIEGAAMAAKILDSFSPFSSNRIHGLFDCYSHRYKYLLHVGYGWAFARLPWLRSNLDRQLCELDPVLKYLALDGYGFHEGYFKWRKSLTQRDCRDRLAGYQQNAFDQGLGRSLLFIAGGNVQRIVDLVSEFEPNRLADIWSGIGLAVGYAGGISRAEAGFLALHSKKHFPNLAQGVCFASEARSLAGHVPEHTELACLSLCDMPASEATRLTRAIRSEIDDSNPHAYLEWRENLSFQFENKQAEVMA